METQQQAKPRKLTRKQKGFVQDYIATGNGTQSALKNYDTTDYNTANVIAVENLQKPTVKEAIESALSEDFLDKKHKELFEQKRVDYFVFPKTMADEEIVEHVASVGITVITVRTSDKGKMAFYAVPDAQAIKGALDMSYKIIGKYAPEKSVNVNIELEADEEIKKLTEQLNGIHRGASLTSNGGTSSPVGTEVQDKD